MLEQDIADIDAAIVTDMQSNAYYLREIAASYTNKKTPALHQKILLMSCKMINYQGQQHTQLGVILEYIFAATRLHDDTMEQKIKCQDETISLGIKGKNSRILVGDFFYSKGFNLMAKLDEIRVVSCLSNAINEYTQGQTLQIDQAKCLETTEQDYFKKLKLKSSLYYACIAKVIGIVSQCPQKEINALNAYCFHLGSAMQIIEETLSYLKINTDELNKQPNLPLLVIKALQQINPELHQSFISNPDTSSQICQQTDSFMQIYNIIKTEIYLAQKSIAMFPESNYRLALEMMAKELCTQLELKLAELGYNKSNLS